MRPAAEELQRHQQALQQTIGDANKALDQILNADQRTRLDQLRGAANACQVIPAFKAVGLL